MTWEGLSPPYATIVADPPWRFRAPGASPKGDATRHYSTLSIPELCSLEVASLATENAHLWLWALNGMMEEAHQVVRAWGFSALTMVTWCKPGPGVGYYLRNNTEHAILASRGRPMTPEHVPLSTWYQWPRTQHSVKPAGFLDLVEQVSPGPYVELFARQGRLGWDTWGLGVETPSS